MITRPRSVHLAGQRLMSIAAGRGVEGNRNRPARAKGQVRLQSTIFDPNFAVAAKTVSAHRYGLNHRAPTADPRAIRVYARAAV